MNPLTLPKSSLLKDSWEFNRVYQQGKRLRGDNFSLVFASNNLAENRLGISIHGQLKGSVQRNRIKRIIREFYRLNREFLPPPTDIVFTVRQGFALKNPTEVEQAIRHLLLARKKTGHHAAGPCKS
ncbi:MAG: ribonuclease P protein component [Deltaproteobacteria bacterium RIFOXYD12_FULL_57_12]|nr:MAG: ribonuclease P protein component [Deltaproteobacteria bacterium RIFOXYD12_FULL_57_12]